MNIQTGVEVYRTVQNEWRRIERFGALHGLERLFTAQGKLHVIHTLGIYVRDTDNNSWQQRHSNSFPSLGAVYTISILPYWIVVQNDELLLGVYWFRKIDRRVGYRDLLQSKGFGSEIKEIVWEKVPSFLEAGQTMCTIEL